MTPQQKCYLSLNYFDTKIILFTDCIVAKFIFTVCVFVTLAYMSNEHSTKSTLLKSYVLNK